MLPNGRLRPRLRRAACLAVIGSAGVLPVAGAAAPTGSWSGQLTDFSGSTVTFGSTGSEVRDFTVHGTFGTFHCGGGPGSSPTTSSATIYIPSAAISGSTFSTVYSTSASGVSETDYLDGQISGGQATGTVRQQFDSVNCGSGVLRWSAAISGTHPVTAPSSPPPKHTYRSRAGGSYAGTTGQGYRATVKVARNGRAISRLLFTTVDERCSDGSSASEESLDLRDIHLNRSGAFNDTGSFPKLRVHLVGRIRIDSADLTATVTSKAGRLTCVGVTRLHAVRRA